MFALPNVHIREPIEVDGFALVPWNDERLATMARANRNLNSLLAAFRTEFGDQIEPPVIIWRSDMPDTYRSVTAISGFRDAIALSVVPMAWAQSLRFDRHGGAHYSDTFSVYPWMTDRNDEHLITRTPAMFGIHDVQRLRPQSMAALPIHHLEPRDIDFPMRDELLRRWQRCFATPTPDPADERIFRLLNMANAAAKLPAGADANSYDTLRAVALWASAFEILRPSRNQAYRQIYELLEQVTWNYTPCKTKEYRCFGDGDGTLRALPLWLYGEITRLRNDTLHGNPIPEDRLVPEPAKRPISLYAAPLYRIVLAAVLELKHIPGPRNPDNTDYENFRADQFEFGKYQRDIEVALETVLFTPDEFRERHTRGGRVLRPAPPSTSATPDQSS